MIIPRTNSLILFGGGNLLLSVAKWSLKVGFDVKIVTSPRFLHEKMDDGKEFHAHLSLNVIPYISKTNLYDTEFFDFIEKIDSSFCLSIAAPWIFRENQLRKIFRNRLFNLHGTRLPQGRGGAPISWQIMMGIKLGFCQLHQVSPGIDDGDIIATEEFLYPATARLPKEYMSIYEKRNLRFLQKILKKILVSQFQGEGTKQSDYLSTYYPRLKTDVNGWINWNLASHQLECFICAFDNPYIGAQTLLNGKKVHLRKVLTDQSDPIFHEYQYGLIYRTNKKWINICINGGFLIVTKLTDENGNDILKDIKVGDRLHTPMRLLEEAKQRVHFGAV